MTAALPFSLSRKSLKAQIVGLIGWLLLCFVAASAGAVASINAATYYGQLIQPTWAPPAWLFGPVWTMLYSMMAVSAWLVWRQYDWRTAGAALVVFVVQLLANALWTWLFFTLHWGAVALAEIIVLWLLIAATILLFWRLHRTAAVLLSPYLIWVSFATALTLALWRLNPTLLG